MSDKPRDIPALPSNLDPDLKKVLDQWREALQKVMGTRGSDRAVRTSDMQTWGYLDPKGNSTGGTGAAGEDEEPDLSPPPVSSTLTVAAGVTSLLIEWETPIYTAGHGHGQTNIYGAQWAVGAPEPVFEDASLIGSAGGALTIYAHPTNPNTRWCIWIRWQSRDGVEGAVKGGLHGVQATTGKIGNAQLGPLAVQAAQLADGAVDLQSGSVKSDGAFGALAVGYTVTRYLLATDGLLANLVVDNAQIANLSVAKLIGGTLAVGAHIQSTNYVAGVSGWIDRSDGYSERNNTVVRGTVYATAGEFSATVRMGAASSYGSGLGLWQGYDGVNYVWRVGDPDGNKIQWDGSQISVYIAGQSQPILAAGGISAGTGTLVINTPGLSLNSAGDAVFAGMLAAATGTFAGTLSAGTVTPAAFEAIVYEYATPGSFALTVPAKRDGWAGLAARITKQGGGGGGGGAYGTGAPNSNPIASGAGGGAGQRTVIVLESVTPGEVLNLVVGARGSGGGASQTNVGGATAGTGLNGGSTTVTRVTTSITYTANGGTGGKGGWRNSDANHEAGFAVTPAGSLGGQAGYGRNSLTGLTFDGDGNLLYTTNGANGGYGGSSQYGAGGAAGTHWYMGASSGGDGGRGAGGGGGGVDAQHPNNAYTGNGGQGGAGYILIEFYDPFSVVTNKRYGPLIEWLDTRGFGSVPAAAR